MSSRSLPATVKLQLYTVKINIIYDLTTEWLLQLQGARWVTSFVYVFCRNNKVLRVSMCVASYKLRKLNHFGLELHTLASDQLITRYSLTKLLLFR